MSYKAKVYKVFIASPDDVKKEREIIRSVLMRWNDINSESKGIVLLPVGWDTHAAPDSGKTAQEYINEDILDTCDILIGVFWSKIGQPTKNAKSGTIEEIKRHLSERKLAMLYFSTKEMPNNVDLKQIKKVRELKEEIEKKYFYGEFSDENDLKDKLYKHIELKIAEGKFRSTWDSDLLAKIDDDKELIIQINKHFPLVARHLLENIIDQTRADEVWLAIVQKLKKSPADLRESLIFMAKRGAFRHKAYEEGYKILAEFSQPDFGNFMSALASINIYEFEHIIKQNLLQDSVFSRRLLELVYDEK